MKRGGLNTRQRNVLAALTKVAERGDVCPSNAALAEDINCDTKTAAEAVAELRELGIIDVVSLHAARQVTIVATGAKTAAVEGKPHWRVRHGLRDA